MPLEEVRGPDGCAIEEGDGAPVVAGSVGVEGLPHVGDEASERRSGRFAGNALAKEGAQRAGLAAGLLRVVADPVEQGERGAKVAGAREGDCLEVEEVGRQGGGGFRRDAPDAREDEVPAAFARMVPKRPHRRGRVVREPLQEGDLRAARPGGTGGEPLEGADDPFDRVAVGRLVDEPPGLAVGVARGKARELRVDREGERVDRTRSAAADEVVVERPPLRVGVPVDERAAPGGPLRLPAERDGGEPFAPPAAGDDLGRFGVDEEDRLGRDARAGAEKLGAGAEGEDAAPVLDEAEGEGEPLAARGGEGARAFPVGAGKVEAGADKRGRRARFEREDAKRVGLERDVVVRSDPARVDAGEEEAGARRGRGRALEVEREGRRGGGGRRAVGRVEPRAPAGATAARDAVRTTPAETRTSETRPRSLPRTVSRSPSTRALSCSPTG